jgi:hypothetical protein
VTLNQSDYERWLRCQHPTAQPPLVAAFEKFLLKREPATSILSQFDCAVIRRYFPAVDRELPSKL